MPKKRPSTTKKTSSKASTTSVPFYRRHWGSNEARNRTRLIHHLEKLRLERPWIWFKDSHWWQKVGIIIVLIVMLVVGTMYGVAEWYIQSNKNKPMNFGVTFVPSYAEYLGLDPQETMSATINDLGVRNFRLVSYWNELEPKPGVYDFKELDREFAQIDAVGGTVSLAIGLRQPRWPECHPPDWIAGQPTSQWYPELNNFITLVVNRYKNNPALVSYQLENEYFLKAFGICSDFNRQRLVDEFNNVKQIDPNHPVIIARSNNALGLPIGAPTPDEFGVSVYKRVWDKTITHRYFEYPIPAWFYAFLAGAGKIVTGKDLIIHELQAEPWAPKDEDIRSLSIAEQDKSMDAARLTSRFEYARATGIKTVYVWGVEWWYFRKVHDNDASVWNAAKAEFNKYQNPNAYNAKPLPTTTVKTSAD